MKVRLTDYSETWAEMYQTEVALLNAIFGNEIIRYEHFGSTSIPGMKAKPVIDMLCVVKAIEVVDLFQKRMVTLGYDAAGEWGIKGRRLFRKGGENRTHHIHFYQINNPEIDRHLILRDYLRLHQKEAEKYSKFKQELAACFVNTKEYSQAKKSFVHELEQKALYWYTENKKTSPQNLLKHIGGVENDE